MLKHTLELACSYIVPSTLRAKCKSFTMRESATEIFSGVGKIFCTLRKRITRIDKEIRQA